MCVGEVLLVSYLFENLEAVKRFDTRIPLDKHDRYLIKSPILKYVMFLPLI